MREVVTDIVEFSAVIFAAFALGFFASQSAIMPPRAGAADQVSQAESFVDGMVESHGAGSSSLSPATTLRGPLLPPLAVAAKPTMQGLRP